MSEKEFTIGVLHEAQVRYNLKKMTEEAARKNNSCNTVSWPYLYAPYFTESEINDQIKSFKEHYHRDMGEHDASFHRMDPEIFRNKVKEVQSILKNTEDPEEVTRLKGELIKLGWNPEVECDESTLIKAKERIVKRYNKELNENCSIIDYTDEKVYNESSLDSRILYMIFFENGHSYACINNIDIRDAGLCEVYSINITNNPGINIRKLIEAYNNTRFDMPANYKAMLGVKSFWHESVKPTIYKIYSGDFSEFKR